MARIRIIIAGAAGGIVIGILSFAIILAAVTASREGPGAGFAILVVSPLYIFLYIVVFFNTLLPAGVITGTAAGLGEALLRKPWNVIMCSLTGIICGVYFSIRFTDIVLESRDTHTDLVVGGIAGGLFLALSGAALCEMLRRSFGKSDQ